jgi:hypothetical protein
VSLLNLALNGILSGNPLNIASNGLLDAEEVQVFVGGWDPYWYDSFYRRKKPIPSEQILVSFRPYGEIAKENFWQRMDKKVLLSNAKVSANILSDNTTQSEPDVKLSLIENVIIPEVERVIFVKFRQLE